MENDYTVEEAIVFRNRIKNATLLSNSEYIAKKGCKIETQRVHNTKTIKVFSHTMPKDYLGKDFIKVCRKIRKYANANRIKLDTKSNQANLVKLIENCGVSLHDFVRGYLCNLQPFALDLYDKDIWHSDIGYGLHICLRLEKGYILVSFIQNVIEQDYTIIEDTKCTVIVDSLKETPTGCYAVYEVQRGFLVLQIYSEVKYLNTDIALVEEKVINQEFISKFQSIVDTINNNYVGASKEYLLWKSVRCICSPFIYYGSESVDNIVCLCDLYANQQNNLELKRMIFTLVFAIFFRKTNFYREETLSALNYRYKGRENELYSALLEKYSFCME